MMPCMQDAKNGWLETEEEVGKGRKDPTNIPLSKDYKDSCTYA